jgi:hypothetical protein
MFQELRKLWGDSADPGKIIEELREYTSAYRAIAVGDSLDRYDPMVRMAVRHLVRMRPPAAIYPFVMKLLRQSEAGHITGDSAASILNVVEAFLVRRALAGVEPTGLLALFRNLWNNIRDSPTAETTAAAIQRRTTIDWPDDLRLKEQIRERAVYGSVIAKYVLLEYDRSSKADFPGIEPWIEHILPQHQNAEWRTAFTPEQHRRLVNTWANLLPLSSSMNVQLSQQGYEAKRILYQQDSAFSSARRLAEEYGSWTVDDIARRADQLAAWAANRWPKPLIA